MEKLGNLEEAVNAAIAQMPWCDCDVIPGAPGTFVIACSDDLTYYHTIELTFVDVLFVQCRYDFHVDVTVGLFGVAVKAADDFQIDSSAIADGYRQYTILDEDGPRYRVIAKELSVSYDAVLRYHKEPLESHQRLATWLNKS